MPRQKPVAKGVSPALGPKSPKDASAKQRHSEKGTPTKPKAETRPKPKSAKPSTNSTPPTEPLPELVDQETYWCKVPSQTIEVKLEQQSQWLCELMERPQGKKVRRKTILIRGLCPFHVVASKYSDGSVVCGGCQTHVHEEEREEGEHGGPVVHERVVDEHEVLLLPLVTQPMSMDALLRSPELRLASLFVYMDIGFSATYASKYGELAAAGRLTSMQFSLPEVTPLTYTVNPACQRVLQQRVTEARWLLNNSRQYSVDEWCNKIGQDNILLYWRGSRAPLPQDERFRASDREQYPMSLAFMTRFQKQQWDEFLSGPYHVCYLDSVFSCDTHGFQLWVLFYERQAATVPMSFMITTGSNTRVVSEWLVSLPQLEDWGNGRTLYINSLTLLPYLQDVFHTWTVRYGKYQVVQELRYMVLRNPEFRGKCPESLQKAVANLRTNYHNSMVHISTHKQILSSLPHLFGRFDDWNPTEKQWRKDFNHSLDAVSRWRYLLWMTMVSRPPTSRIDSVLYYLCQELLPGIQESLPQNPTSARAPDSSVVCAFDMDRFENGNPERHEELKDWIFKSLTKDIHFFVSNDRELAGKIVVDTRLNVCYCAKFAAEDMCEHLIYCSTDNIHQPRMTRLLNELPTA
ncbi:hypothetical protein GGI07_001898 [Coemansia sp. Benny D115]|nr:hypothetical protein GGI07_001898 [Coemansia sp. Benny D115]